MALGLKRIETRHWATSYRGPLAIHAAKRWTVEEREMHEIERERGTMPDELPLGAIVAVAVLHDIKPTWQLPISKIGELEWYWGNYGPQRFGWLFADIVPLAEPIPFRGMQGLFDVPDDVFAPGYRPPPVAPVVPTLPHPQRSLFA